MVKSKYQSVLDLGEKLSIENGDVQEENGVLKVKGTAKTQYEKNLIWDEIKAVGGENPSDIMADIRVADEEFEIVGGCITCPAATNRSR